MKSRCLTLSLIALFVLLTGALPAQALVRVAPIPEGLPLMGAGVSQLTCMAENAGTAVEGRLRVEFYDYDKNLLCTLDDAPLSLRAGEFRYVNIPLFVPNDGTYIQLTFVDDEGNSLSFPEGITAHKNLIPLPSPSGGDLYPGVSPDPGDYLFPHFMNRYLKEPHAVAMDFSCISGLLLLYILIAGPGIFLLLRWRKHLELSWILVPVFAVATSLVIYGVTLFQQGAETVAESFQLTMIDGSGQADLTEWIFLRSATSISAQLESASLVNACGGERTETTRSPFPPYRGIREENSFTLTDLDFFPGSSRFFIVHGEDASSVSLVTVEDLLPNEINNFVSATLHYESGPALQNAFLLIHGKRLSLGNLAPSGSPRSMEGTLESIPSIQDISGYEARWTGNREEDMTRLLNTFGIQSGLEPQNAYLVGWVDSDERTAIDPEPVEFVSRSLVAILLAEGTPPPTGPVILPTPGGKR